MAKIHGAYGDLAMGVGQIHRPTCQASMTLELLDVLDVFWVLVAVFMIGVNWKFDEG